ncbi:sulfatase-like hydrolase/transferase [uncultured Draconibacterium sp.]|uniref:sulfatase-like hydrolase/transferase n=1 Tax=uncultured Draconibacterium sp. TaxID=1573823 RepID=UPI0029C02BC1|nr:sulfatase-like hydrolase/transferase [uncultured Draconibacterium sp.]
MKTLSLLVSLLLLFPVFLKAEKKEQPNIIFIYTDDQRRDALGATGNDVIITPQIDKLAKQGLQFNKANVVFALCSPSRAALLTGRYNSANGVMDLGSDLNQGEVSLANYLKEAGYSTAVSGKWHVGQSPEKLGFDFHVIFHANGTYYGRQIDDMGEKKKVEKHCDEYCVDRSIDFLKEAAKSDKPFFLYHNTQLPHMNGVLIWDAKEETLAKYNVDDMPVTSSNRDDLSGKPEYLKKVRNLKQAKKYGYPDEKAIQQHTKEYYSVITEMDDALGRLFATIEELGLRENTYIFFMSDNGWMLGEHGFTSKVLPYKPATEVPFFVVGPGIKEGTNKSIVLNIDMAPTILDLAGIDTPENMHGASFSPMLKGKKVKDWRKAFVYEGLGLYGGAKPNLTVVSDDYRYIETYDDKELNAPIFKELYNQKEDAEEVTNLAKTKKAEKTIQQLSEIIEQHKSTVLKTE